jgi:hypothetical protein
VNIYTLQGETFLVHDGNVYVKLNPIELEKAANKNTRLCGICHEPGHRKENCPKNDSTSTS